MVYKADAIDTAFGLYCQGLEYTEIEREMKKTWPKWSRQLLYGDAENEGWIKKYNWEERRAKADARKQELSDAIENTEELVIKSLTAALKSLSEKIASQGSQVKADDLAQLNKLSATINKVRERVVSGGTADKAAVFLEFLTVFISFLTEKNPDLAAEFESEYMDEFIQRVKEKG